MVLTLDDTIDTVMVNTCATKYRQRSLVRCYDRSTVLKGKRFIDLSILMNNIKGREKEITVRISSTISCLFIEWFEKTCNNPKATLTRYKIRNSALLPEELILVAVIIHEMLSQK